jgi:hypothetical protein
MIIKGNRRGGKPVLVHDGSISELERVPVETKMFKEEWLQNLIHKNPALLPIDEIDSGFSPLIAIGREIATPAGYIDNLFISPEGYLTIIETKLWRNPEARREVVGQILDYAKELSRWTYTDLDACVVKFNQLYNNNSDGLLATFKNMYEQDETEESYFIDKVSKNLRRGRFLLLIVGDGIRESVEDMVLYLSDSPQLYFTLALVELQVFKMPAADSSLLVIPQLITRTKEITRAVVRVEGIQPDNVKINIETDINTPNDIKNPAGRRLNITADDYFEELEKNCGIDKVAFVKQIIKDAEDLGLFIEWNTGSFSIRLPDPLGSGLKISLLNIDRSGLFYLGYSLSKFEKLKIPLDICYRFTADTAALFPGISPNPEKPNIWNKYTTLSEFEKVYESFMDRLKLYVREITDYLQKEEE